MSEAGITVIAVRKARILCLLVFMRTSGSWSEWPVDVAVLGFRRTVSGGSRHSNLAKWSALSENRKQPSYRAPPVGTWFAYCAERDLIQQAALRLYGRPLPIPASRATSIQPEAQAGQRIAATIGALFAVAARGGPAEPTEPLGGSLEDQLHDDFACALNDARRTGDLRDVEPRRMARAEEYLDTNLSESFSLSGLVEAAGASGRMLERHFRHI